MGECAGCYDSAEMSACKRIARRRMEKEDRGPETDYTRRLAYEHHLQDVIDEFILLHGRPPKASCFD